MEREANYVAVGSFVLLVIAMAGLFFYWYSASRDHRDYTRYEIYFDGSVSGLSQGGPVRYLGVDVGRVVRIRLDQRAADRVQVIVDIDSTTPISKRTLAQLSLQGVTGLLFIDLQQRPANDRVRRILNDVPSEHYPVISSERSNFDAFVSSLPDLTSRVGELVIRASDLLSDDNIAAITRAVANIDRASASLPGTARDAATLIADLRSATAEAHSAIAEIHATTRAAGPDIAATAKQLRATSDNLANASSQLNAFVANNRDALSSFFRDGLPQIDELVRDSQGAAQELREFARSLRRDPSRIIYQPPPPGVEIPR